MDIELKHSKKDIPSKDGLYFAINEKGYIGLVKYLNGEWFSNPFIEKSILFTDKGFYWIDIKEGEL